MFIHPYTRWLPLALALVLTVPLAVGVALAQDSNNAPLLQEVDGSPVLVDLQSELMALSPDGRFVFVANDTTVTAYEVTREGPEEVSGSPFYVAGTDYRPAALAVHPNGRFLYVAHAGFVGRSLLAPVSVFSIQRGTGALVEVRNSPYTTYAASGRGLSALEISPDGRFLYAVNTDNKTVNIFTVNARTGALRERDIVAVGGLTFAPVDLAIRPDGRYLYIANQGFVDDTEVSPINIYRIDSRSGTLRETYRSPIVVETDGGTGLSGVEMHPGGDFLFALNETNKSITLLALDSVGTPTDQTTYAIDGDDFSPRDLSASPNGDLLFITNNGFVPMTLQSPVTILVFDAENLAIAEEWHVNVLAQDEGLGQVAVGPAGDYVYVANPGLGGLHMFAVSDALRDAARRSLRLAPRDRGDRNASNPTPAAPIRIFGALLVLR
jgi:6-phosphogluconolactonase (cycloisomerase 2 family)